MKQPKRLICVTIILLIVVCTRSWLLDRNEALFREDIATLDLEFGQHPTRGLTIRCNGFRPRRIRTLAPLRNSDSINAVIFEDSMISDLSPLKDLSELQILRLTGSRTVSDLSPLARCSQLTEADLSNSSISEITPLGSIERLSVLGIAETHVTDISSLSSLPQIQSLFLGGVRVPDLSDVPAGLLRLNLDPCLVSDLATLERFEQLNSLKIKIERSADMKHIAKLTSLRRLELEAPEDADLSVLSQLSNLSHIGIQGSNGDVSGFATANELSNLSISSHRVTGLSALAGATELRQLSLRTVDQLDLGLFNEMPHLKYLELVSELSYSHEDVTSLKLTLKNTRVDVRTGDAW